MEFDDNGFLLPYQGNVASLEEVAQQFTWNKRRLNIWEKYTSYMIEFRKIIQKEFYQYLDGSFISKKKLPNDLDFVSFIQQSDFENNIETLENMRTAFKPEMDAYIVPIYPSNHKNFTHITENAKAYWEYNFNKKNPN